MRGEGGTRGGAGLRSAVDAIRQVASVLREQLASRPDARWLERSADVGTGAAAARFAGGAIKSRQDAIRALDAVADFFRRNEPSSPIPLFVERAKRLVSKDFLEVLADIAPDALAGARSAGGLKPERITRRVRLLGRCVVAKASSQKFIARNRAPRVQIEYDVELYGAEKKIQLPFVMGVLADLSGKPAEPLAPVADRKFLEIDVDNFDSRMKAMKPRAAFQVRTR